MTSSEKNLIERFREGDPVAFDELYRLTCGRVFRFALRLCGSPDDAEDIVVQTFVAAHRSRESFQARARIETWLYRIAVHMAARVAKSKRVHSVPCEQLPDVEAQNDLRNVELIQLLGILPDHLKIPFLLVKLEGLTHREAAEILGRRLGTVQSQVHEASQRLRKELLAEPYQAQCEYSGKCGYEV